MIKMSWTAVVDDLADPHARKADREQVWQSLLAKAENPLGYVPPITECRILERYEDGFLREIIRNGSRLVQRVTPVPTERIVFTHLDDPEVASITNILDEDDQGRLTFTIEIELAPTGESMALAQSEFLRATDEYFTGVLPPIIETLRSLATAAVVG
jgi:hypothetical protein